MRRAGRWKMVLLTMVCLGGLATSALAEDTAPPNVSALIEKAVADASGDLQNNMNVLWTCIAAFLVFFMQAGFAMVETGFTRAKNAVNILMKNMMDFSVGTVAFFLVGFALMFGAKGGNPLFGWSLFGLSGVEDGSSWEWTFLIFQTVFAATAATIVSGAMAGRS